MLTISTEFEQQIRFIPVVARLPQGASSTLVRAVATAPGSVRSDSATGVSNPWGVTPSLQHKPILQPTHQHVKITRFSNWFVVAVDESEVIAAQLEG